MVNYVLTKDPEKLRQFMTLILERTKITEEDVVKRLKEKPSNWNNRMEALKTLLGGVGSCQLCGAPLLHRNTHKGKNVCVLFPIHSYIKNQLQLGGRCNHDLYMAECQICLGEAVAKAEMYKMTDWWSAQQYETIKFTR